MIQFPTTKPTKDAIRDAIGHLVTFVIRDEATPCPVCSGLDQYDEVNEASLNPFCSTCSGLYWLISDLTSGIMAHVRWRIEDQPNMDVAGETFDGDASITIASDALSEANIVKIRYIEADSRKLQVYRTIYRGVPTRDRIRFICKEWAKE